MGIASLPPVWVLHFYPRPVVSASSPETHRFYGSPLGTVWEGKLMEVRTLVPFYPSLHSTTIILSISTFHIGL